jgi:diketogulonate reductase-like aldo/keto reductase
MIQRIIPSTGEQLPVIGLGTWNTFNVHTNNYAPLQKVLDELFSSGGRLIDSSPMYGRAEQVIGELTGNTENQDAFFYATKVWTTGKQEGIKQMESSMYKMKIKRMDLMQVHNLTDWKTHLATLQGWKEEGRIRYIGITHYTDSMHNELEHIISTERIDFVQFNYSILSRNAEKRLLGAAENYGVATLINRPFGEGNLFSKVKGKPLPPWASELGVHHWGEFFLKYIIAHTAVTCVIPATGNPEHAAENFQCASGSLPDEETRRRMREYINSL